MSKIAVEAVLKVLEYVALTIYGVVKVCNRNSFGETSQDQEEVISRILYFVE